MYEDYYSDYQPLEFIPGDDFDPADPEEMEIVIEASRRDRHDHENIMIRELEAENKRLRAMLKQQQN